MPRVVCTGYNVQFDDKVIHNPVIFYQPLYMFHSFFMHHTCVYMVIIVSSSLIIAYFLPSL